MSSAVVRPETIQKPTADGRPPAADPVEGSAVGGRRRNELGSLLHGLMVLFKVRIVGLLLFAAVAGAFLGAGGWPGAVPFSVLLVSGGLAAAGAGALNEYLERDQDALMYRTRKRPLVTGAIARSPWIVVLGAAMVLVPALAVLPFNPALSFFLILGAVIYVGVYTVWLKQRTPLNIVIGGGAGSCAVLSGGAVAGAWTDPGVLILAGLIFLWTPIHFWSLALVYREDYARAGVPMLPVRTTPRRAAFWGLVHGVAAGLAGLALVLHPALGPLYLVPVLGATLYLLGRGWQLIAEPSARRAWRVFHGSNLYLALLLLAICLDTALRLP